jgi:hypothetical protein
MPVEAFGGAHDPPCKGFINISHHLYFPAGSDDRPLDNHRDN